VTPDEWSIILGVWNKSEAEKELVLLLSGSRKIRRNPEYRAKFLAPVLNPEMSRYVARYGSTAPTSLRPYIREVLVFSQSKQGEINAWAEIHRPHARFINLVPEFEAAMHVTAATVEELRPQVRDLLAERLKAISSQENLVPTTEVFMHLAAHTRAIAEAVHATPLSERLLGVLMEIQKDPVAAVDSFGELRSKYAQVNKPALAQAGVNFSVGHELGHHLLNHNKPNKQIQQGNDNLAPGELELNAWMSNLGAAVPIASRRHKREFQADAMAVLLGSSLRYSDAVESVRDGRSTCAGAFLSTLSLWLCKEFLTPLNEASLDHPPLHHRNLFLLDLLERTFKPLGDKIARHPRLQRSPDNHPSGFAMQIWVCCQVVGHLLE
jgi:hypothetical protein